MTGTTISTATTVSVRITAESQLPLNVTRSGSVAVSNADAVYIAAALTGAVTNLGTLKVTGTSGIGVQALGAASVVNGSTSDSVALVSGVSDGIAVAATATLTNFGIVTATASAGAPGFASVGASLGDGGSVVNGSSGDHTAAITGASVGVAAFGKAATVSNFGTISGTGAAGRGVWLQAGGSVANGSTADTTALISGAGLNAVYASGAATVTNFGTISGTRNGVELRAGGSVVNGSTADTKALITGARYGVYISTYLGGAGPFSVTNFGTILGGSKSGVGLYGAGTVSNGSTGDSAATIRGRTGVYIRDAGTVTNFGTITGTIDAAVALFGGGTVTNGGSSAITALIGGEIYAVNASVAVTNFATIASGGTAVNLQTGGTLSNFGSIAGSSGAVVVLQSGGTLVNGSSADTAAAITGGTGGGNAFYADGLASITNYGTISNSSTHNHSAMDLYAGGTVVNGSTADTAALISSAHHNGIYATNDSIGVTNYGTISALQDNGIILDDGGTVANGSTADTKAAIYGKYNAVYAVAPATVTNWGTLSATKYSGVSFYKDGGSLTNFASGHIIGQWGVYGKHAATDVTNFGTISAGNYAGVDLQSGGTLSNGSVTDTSAIVSSASSNAIYADGSATVTNYGTIENSAPVYSVVCLFAGGVITNGATGDTLALVDSARIGVYGTTDPVTITNFGTILSSASTGVDLKNGGTVTNSGTIEGANLAVSLSGPVAGTVIDSGVISNTAGTTRVAISLGSGPSRVIEDPSASIIGTVYGGGSGVLELAAAAKAGSIAGIGTTYSGFTTLQVDSSATWTLSGSNSIATLTDNGTLSVAGTLDITASLNPASTGTIDLGSTATLEVAAVLGKGPAIAFLGTDQLTIEAAASFGTGIGTPSYAGPLLEHFGATDTIDLVGIAPTLSGAGLVLNYATATGLLTITRSGGSAVASLLFQNSSLGSGSFHIASDAHGGTLLTHS